MAACVLRDAGHRALTREMVELRMEPHMATYREVLGEGLCPEQHALMGLALSFFTWRSLAREGASARVVAVEAMVRAIDCQREAD